MSTKSMALKPFPRKLVIIVKMYHVMYKQIVLFFSFLPNNETLHCYHIKFNVKEDFGL